jgi:hypothetical protein
VKIEEALVYYRTGHRIRLMYPYVNEAWGYCTMMDILDPKERKSFIISDLGFMSSAWEVFFEDHGQFGEWTKYLPEPVFIDKGYTTSKFSGFVGLVRSSKKTSISSLGLDPM